MLAPLRTIMVVLWVTSAAGVALVALMSLGAITWVSFAIAGVVGLAVGIPAGLWSARAIKRDDPSWPPRPKRAGKR